MVGYVCEHSKYLDNKEVVVLTFLSAACLSATLCALCIIYMDYIVYEIFIYTKHNLAFYIFKINFILLQYKQVRR